MSGPRYPDWHDEAYKYAEAMVTDAASLPTFREDLIELIATLACPSFDRPTAQLREWVEARYDDDNDGGGGTVDDALSSAAAKVEAMHGVMK